MTHKLNHQLTAAQRRSLQRAQAGLEPAGVILDELAGSKTGWTFRDLQAGVLPRLAARAPRNPDAQPVWRGMSRRYRMRRGKR